MSMYLIITSKETGRVVLYVRPSRIHKWSILEGHFFFCSLVCSAATTHFIRSCVLQRLTVPLANA